METPANINKAMISGMTIDEFGFARVVVVLTGSAMTQVMPYWIEWARKAVPQTQFRVVVRESAYRFITKHNLESRLGSHVEDDVWGNEIVAGHIELAEWADLIIIYPATLDYASRLARGITDAPSLLAALSTDAMVCVAPALPPRSRDNPVVQQTMRLLQEPENFVVIEPISGPSESSASPAWIPPTLPVVLRKLEALRAQREARDRGDVGVRSA